MNPRWTKFSVKIQSNQHTIRSKQAGELLTFKNIRYSKLIAISLYEIRAHHYEDFFITGLIIIQLISLFRSTYIMSTFLIFCSALPLVV